MRDSKSTNVAIVSRDQQLEMETGNSE